VGAKVADLVRAMEDIAPPSFAASWDNVGLIVGDPEAPLDRVVLAIDCTAAVLLEVTRGGANALVAYHPPIFRAQKRFTAESVAFRAARAGVAVYSPHTALDVAPGGTNDALADAIGMTDRAPLRPGEAAGAEVKLVTFVPAEQVEAVSDAVFAAGAGRIGKYSSCSFRGTGVGTFYGEEGAQPVIGRAGRLEQAPEVRLETVVPTARIRDVVRALRSAHPYEEPAFDLVRLAPAPAPRGLGLVGRIPRATVLVVVDRVKDSLGVRNLLATGALDREITRVAVCAGSAGELVGDAMAAGAELLLTGELRHHDALAALAAGLSVICTRHSTSERLALAPLARKLEAALPGVSIFASTADAEPFEFV
jgi:dinuclear metal center YbgI/SA1388 family protein